MYVRLLDEKNADFLAQSFLVYYSTNTANIPDLFAQAKRARKVVQNQQISLLCQITRKVS
jgi:hypothetical protein